MTTATAKGIVDNVINLGGVVEAATASVSGGTITLGGDDAVVNITGNISTGDINVNAKTINIDTTVKHTDGTVTSQLSANDIISNAETVNVMSNNASIQQGVDFAKDGGTVHVSSGIYFETVTIDKSASLYGEKDTEGNLLTTVAPEDTAFTVNGNNVLIDSFKIDSAETSGTDNYGIYVTKNASNVTITNNHIYDTKNHAIFARKSTGFLTISNNRINGVSGSDSDAIKAYNIDGTVTISNNTITNVDDEAIEVRAHVENGTSGNVVITGNTIDTSGDDGIQVANVNTSVTISDNTVLNTGSDGIEVHDSNNTEITRNTISNSNDQGIEADYTDGINIVNNTINTTGKDGIWVGHSSDATIANNPNITNTGTNGITLFGSVDATIQDNIINMANENGIALLPNYSGWSYYSDNADIIHNTITNAGENGIYTFDSYGLYIFDNTIDTTTNGDGIYVERAMDTSIINNTILNAANNGITQKYEYSYFEIEGNEITASGNNGINVEYFTTGLIDNNTVSDSGDNGIVVKIGADDYKPEMPSMMMSAEFNGDLFQDENDSDNIYPDTDLVISNNTVTGSGLSGIVLGDIFNVVVDNNTVSNSGTYGLLVEANSYYSDDENNEGYEGVALSEPLSSNNNITTITLTDNRFTNNPVGARFETGIIDVSNNNLKNTFIGGHNGIEFDGENVSLADSTLGATTFENQTGFYVKLDNGALFAPGTPTVIDGSNVSFDGIVPSENGNVLPAGDYVIIEAKLNDYDDNNTLGQIFAGDQLTVDYYDILNNFINGFTFYNSGSLIITGLPGLNPAGGNNNPAAFFAGISPAAGGNDEDGEGNNNPEELNNLSPAAGTPEAGTYAELMTYLANNGIASFNLSNDPTQLLGQFR